MLEAALDKAVRAIPVETKMRDAVRAGKLEHAPGYMLDDMALDAGIIDAEEYERLDEAREARKRGRAGGRLRAVHLPRAAMTGQAPEWLQMQGWYATCMMDFGLH